MGQAKNRGTREQRIVQSIESEQLKKAEAKREVREWWESLTEEEQQAGLEKYRKDKLSREDKHRMISVLAGLEAGR